MENDPATTVKNERPDRHFVYCSVDGSGGQVPLEEEYAYYYFLVLAVLLGLAAVTSAVFSGMLKEKFGTFGYFLAVRDP